jgi:hypothetical protein
MFGITTIVCLVFGADAPASTVEGNSTSPPRVVVLANTTTILQRDPLLLATHFHNLSQVDVRLIDKPALRFDYVDYYVRTSGEWRRVPTLQEVRSPRGSSSERGIGRTVLSKSVFAQCDVIHRAEDAFLFENVGEYEIRAVLQTTVGQMISQPVKVSVEARPMSDLKRITEAAKVLHYLEFLTLQWNPPEKIKALEELGGNVGLTIRNARQLQEMMKAGNAGQLKYPKDRIEELLEQVDPVSREIALDRLAKHTTRWSDREGMQYLASMMANDSLERREMLRHMRLLRGDDQRPQWIRSDFGKEGEDVVESD